MKSLQHLIIVGEGLAGASVVAALRDQYQITVLAKRVPQAFSDVRDERPISLSYATVVFLKNLKLWDTLSPHAAMIQKVHVSEKGRLGTLLLDAAQAHLEALGYVVPFCILLQTLRDYLLAQKNVTRMLVDDISAIEESSDGVQVTIEDNEKHTKITADYLIAADGVHSRCRTLLNIPVDKATHDDVAMAAILTLETPHDGVAYERFTKDGVLALLPMWDQYQYRLVWTLDTKKAEALTQAQLKATVEATFASRVGAIQSIERKGAYPLTTMLAKKQATQRCVLVGDSAHRIYPIAAQGYNLTVRDIAVLLDQLQKHDSLAHYADNRRRDQKFIIRFTQSLEWVFGLQMPLLDHLRASSLFAMDLMPALKRRLIQKLLGRRAKQPPLLCE